VPKVKLTARNVLTLRAAPGGRRRTYTDSTLPGFVLRVLPSGARRYAVRYGAAGDRSVPIGDARVLPLADARIRAKAVLLRVDKGEDPILGSRPPAEITRPELREAVARITERHGTTQANEALKVARWVLARALDSDLIAANPAAGIRKVAKERPRDRVLTVAELRSVWNAAGEAGVYGQGVRFAILTGARRSEVFRATWGEVDREAKLWRLPAARTKSRRAHEVPLTPDMTAVLDELPAGKPDARLFPVAPTSKEWRSLLAEAEIIGEAEEDAKASKRTRADRWPIRFHDLRRTFRNALTAELNVPPHVAEALVGHAESGLVRTYAPSGVPLAERRRALERWGRHVLAIAAGKRLEKVATFPGRAR
jgi:integrase